MDIAIGGSENTEYRERYEKAPRGSGLFVNCTSLVKSLIFGGRETFIHPNTAKAEGLIPYLDWVDILSLEDAQSYDEYVEKSQYHDVVAVLINQKGAWSYVHFAFIDPEDPSMVYHRSDLERDPEHTSYEAVLEYADLFTDNSEVYLAFLDKKD